MRPHIHLSRHTLKLTVEIVVHIAICDGLIDGAERMLASVHELVQQ